MGTSHLFNALKVGCCHISLHLQKRVQTSVSKKILGGGGGGAVQGYVGLCGVIETGGGHSLRYCFCTKYLGKHQEAQT